MNATLRRIGALTSKDLADLLKNPTMFVVLLMPIGFMLLFRFVTGDVTAGSRARNSLPSSARSTRSFWNPVSA